jgi:uncharacterized protein YjdB
MIKINNQPYYSRCLMALVLLLMPLGVWAQKSASLRWGDSNVSAAFVEVTQWTVNWSERAKAYPKLSNPYQLMVSYSSSDTSVATVDGNGVITPLAPGKSTVITASYVGNDFESCSASYTLTFIDDRNTVEDLGFGFASSTADVTYGDATVNVPSLDMGKLAGAPIIFSSSVPSVATVDPASGQVAIVGAAITVISASFAGDDNVKPGSVSYTLTVYPREIGLQWGTTSFSYDGSTHVPTATATGLVGSDVCSVTVDGAQTNAGSYTATASALSNTNYNLPATNTTAFTIAKADALVTFVSKSENARMGESYAGQTATTSPTGLTLTYVSSAPAVATVDSSTGAVTLVAPGSTTITATFAGNNNYNAAEDSYTLSVVKADAVEIELSFGSEAVMATYGDAAVAVPTLNNPLQLPLVWASGNENVAIVNASGDITIVGVGQAIIYASFAGNDEYRTKTIYFTLTVNKSPVSVAFTTSSETATLGENYVSPKATVNPSGITLVYSSSDESVASVDANTGEVTLVGSGTVMIRASFIGSDNYESASDYYTLTVEDPRPRLEPIVKEMDYSLDEDAYFLNVDGSEIDLSNTIINKILFTLKNQSSPEGDGYDTEDHSIVINTATTTSTVNALIANNVEPGSEGYANQFTGMTFLVPAGEGYIVVTSQEADGVYLMVKVGENDPVAIHQSEMGDYSIPYKSDSQTLVRMWKGVFDSQNYSSTRGRKKMADVRVTKVTCKSVSSNSIQRVSAEAFEDARWYDLNGQRISQPVKKGVYIHGNRKVVIK